MKGPRARRCDVEVRGQAPIRVDLVRRKGDDRPRDVRVCPAFESGAKEPDVSGHHLDVGVGRDDENNRSVPNGSGEECLRRANETRNDATRHTKPCAADTSP
jgi:hypothetical protein